MVTGGRRPPLAVLLAIVCAVVLVQGDHPDQVMTPPSPRGDPPPAPAAPAAPAARSAPPPPPPWSPAAPERAERAERSANLSHIAGAGRKIMMYVRNRHLQILPDGTVNGTESEASDYAVIQRTSVNKVQVKMQGIATCLFLCIDACGLLYGSKELTDDCVFNEMLEQHYYNSYSSAKYSSRGRSLYLALDRRGAPRRVQLRRDAAPGRLSAYTRVLTKPVAAERVADLLVRLRGAPGAAPGAAHFRHRGHHSACPPHGHPQATPRRPQRCPRPAARRPGGGTSGPQQRRRFGGGGRPTALVPTSTPAPPAPARPPLGPLAFRRKCEATEDEDLCHKRLQMIAAKKRKSRNEEKKSHLKRHRKGAGRVLTTTAATTTTTTTTITPPPPSPASYPSAEDEDGDDEEDQDDAVTMTTEAVTTEVVAVGAADDHYP